MAARIRKFLVYSASIAFAVLAGASEPKWKPGTFSHVSQDEPLRSLIESLASANGMSAVISARVSEKVSGKFQNQDPQRFLQTLSEANDLIWYCEGSTLFVYRSGEIRNQMVQMQSATVAKLVSSLKESGVWDARYPLKSARREGLAYISGPPRYVELVVQTAGRLDNTSIETAPAFADNQLVRVFPLRYAWAADQMGSSGDRQTQVPGVASLLGALINRQPLGADMFTQSMSALQGGQAREELSIGTATPFPFPQGIGTTGTPQVSIQADIRTNSVVVKDTRENLKRFQSLVNALDVPCGLIELNIAIIDVSSASNTDLGVEWQLLSKGSIGGRSATTVQGQTFSTLAPGGTPAVPGILPGYSIAALAETATSTLMARIHALEAVGKAKIAARPAVLTFDNVEARISQTQTFHVRVSGEREAKLFKVEAGTVVKVTPHLVEEGGGRSIKLNIEIEDGSLADKEVVDNIPIVSNSNINTQAIVAEQQSLLLGGFIRTEESTSQSRVPVLGAIPVVGLLFSKTSKVRNRIERVFMITPKIIRTAADAGETFVLDEPEKSRDADVRNKPLDPLDPAGGFQVPLPEGGE